jgi:hypothetical protein
MSKPFTGYALTSHFRKLRLRWVFTHLEAYLFIELIAVCNDEDWPAEFSVTNQVLAGALGCSEKGLIKARNTLKEAGLLTYVEGKNRRPTTYRFCPLKGLPKVSISSSEPLPEGLPEVRDAATEFSSQGLPEGLPEVSVLMPEISKHLPEGLPKGLPEVSPYKEQTKTKKKVCSNLENESASEVASFEQFWTAFDKKVGRSKSVERWGGLKPAEQAAILAHLPAYVAATPDKQFRKDPASYLHNRTWEDEELPPARGGGRSLVPLVPATETQPAKMVPAPNEEFLAQQAAATAAAQQAHFDKFKLTPA